MTTDDVVSLPGMRMLRMPEIKRITGLPRSTIYRLAGAGTFPASVRLAPRAVGWRESDVAAWLAARTATEAE